MTEQSPEIQAEGRLVPVEQPFCAVAGGASGAPVGLSEIRKIPAVTLKMATILRTRLIDLCGEPSEPEGPMYPPTVEDIAFLLEGELSFADLVTMLQDTIEHHDYSYPLAVAAWVNGLVSGDHKEGPTS